MSWRATPQHQFSQQQPGVAWQPGVCGSVYPTILLFGSSLWLLLRRESEEKLAKQAEEKALEKAREAGELVEAVEDKADEVVSDKVDRLETASAQVLDLEEGTPESLGVMVAKVAVVSAVVVTLKRTPRFDVMTTPWS